MEKEKILEINHMKISFCQYQKGMHQTELPVISDLNVTVRAGEMVAIVGSSEYILSGSTYESRTANLQREKRSGKEEKARPYF